MERSKTLKNGGIVRIRHVSRDDAPALREGLYKVTANDMHSRFFSSGNEFDLSYLQLLANVDEEREIALLAVNPNDTNDIWAGGRLYIDSASRRAEYGTLVRSDLQGIGLGGAILEALIESGRQRGLLEIWGMVSNRNQAMLIFLSQFGFETRRDPDDAGTNIVTKKL